MVKLWVIGTGNSHWEWTTGWSTILLLIRHKIIFLQNAFWPNLAKFWPWISYFKAYYALLVETVWQCNCYQTTACSHMFKTGVILLFMNGTWAVHGCMHCVSVLMTTSAKLDDFSELSEMFERCNKTFFQLMKETYDNSNIFKWSKIKTNL